MIGGKEIRTNNLNKISINENLDNLLFSNVYLSTELVKEYPSLQGYVGGFYDRTFANFNKINHNFISIGFAYEEQKASKVYRDIFDYKLNYILTEKHLYTFL